MPGLPPAVAVAAWLASERVELSVAVGAADAWVAKNALARELPPGLSTERAEVHAMRVLYMMPTAKGVYPPEAEERRMNVIRSYATPSTQIDVDFMPGVSGFSPWGGTSEPPADAAARAAQLSAQRAVQAEREGYDAFCPFGTLDIGVKEARQLVKIPVVGQAEACFLFCGLLDRPFASCIYM